LVRLSIASGFISLKKEAMNAELSREDCVKLNPLLTCRETVGATVEPIPPEKKPVTELGAWLQMVGVIAAYEVTFPEPTTDGISRNVIGICWEDRTMFNRILSLA
jgi:hypothetical protein